MSENGIHITSKQVLIIVLLALAIITATYILVNRGCNENQTIVSTQLDIKSSTKVLNPLTPQIKTALPDIVILESGNKYTVEGLADAFSETDSSSLQYICPIAVFGDTNSFITDDSVKMIGFLEIKVMRVTDGWFSESYKGVYHFASTCLPYVQCKQRNTIDTIFYNQEDVYWNDISVAGRGDYVVEVTVNDAGLWTECNNCYKNSYFFGFSYTPCYWNNLYWCATRNDTLLTPKIKAKLKNYHK